MHRIPLSFRGAAPGSARRAARGQAPRRARNPYTRASGIWVPGSPPSAAPRNDGFCAKPVGPDRSAQARQVVGKLDELCIVDRLQRLEHYRLVSAARPALVLAQGFQQVVLALIGQSRHALLSGEIGAMTSIAVILLGKRASPLEPHRVARIA